MSEVPIWLGISSSASWRWCSCFVLAGRDSQRRRMYSIISSFYTVSWDVCFMGTTLRWAASTSVVRTNLSSFYQLVARLGLNVYRHNISLCLPIDNIWAMTFVRRIREDYRNCYCAVVWQLCPRTHTHTHMNSLLKLTVGLGFLRFRFAVCVFLPFFPCCLLLLCLA